MNNRKKKFTKDSLKMFILKNEKRLAYDSWVSVEHNFFYINIPKTGCTKIKKMLQAICGLPVPEGINPIHSRASGTFVKSLCDLNIEEQLYLLNAEDVNRICFVRNPYTRLLSGYWNKVAGPKKYGKLNELIFKHAEIADNHRVPTFMELMNFILKMNPNHLDIHFRSQFKVCHFDQIDYNQIGYFENFKEDIIRIFEKLGASQDILNMTESIENPSSQDTSLESRLLNDLKKSETGQCFYNSFINDFNYFNYDRL